MIEISPTERRALRAAAHHLKPVVSISQKGLTSSVMAEIDRSLKAHELIKLRLYGIEREDREALSSEICTALPASMFSISATCWCCGARPRNPCAGQESAPTRRRQAKPANKKQAAARTESRNRKA
jgi:RNA-binding protein